jgi:hypothetical protein
MSLEEDKEIKIICEICQCLFEVIDEQEKLKKKCIFCFTMKNTKFEETKIKFFEDLFDIKKLENEDDFIARKNLIDKLYYKIFFKLINIDFIKYKYVEISIDNFIKKLEEMSLLTDNLRKYIFNTKNNLI